MQMLKLPKEHGAWAMLYVPFVLGGIAGRTWTWRLLLLWIAVTALFIGRDSLVQWGHARRRGRPAPEGRVALVYFVLTLAGGAPLVLADQLYGLLPLGLLAAAALWWNFAQSVARQARTTTTELLTIAGLTLTAPTAYYVAGLRLDATAIWLWALCALYFISSVFYVKLRVLVLQPRKADERRAIRRYSFAYHALLALSLAVVVWQGLVHASVILAYVPIIARATWHLLRPIRALNLQQVGVLEILYSVNFLVFAGWAFRTV